MCLAAPDASTNSCDTARVGIRHSTASSLPPPRASYPHLLRTAPYLHNTSSFMVTSALNSLPQTPLLHTFPTPISTLLTLPYTSSLTFPLFPTATPLLCKHLRLPFISFPHILPHFCLPSPIPPHLPPHTHTFKRPSYPSHPSLSSHLIHTYLILFVIFSPQESETKVKWFLCFLSLF